MEENENRQDGNVYSDGAASVDGQLENLQQQGNGQQQQAEPVYARIDQYINLYGGPANQTVNYGKVKPANVKKKHPVFKRMVLSIVSGIVFGLFAGLGVYVVYELSGLDVNQAKIASVKEQMDDLASQMEDMQASVNHQELSLSPEILI